MMTGEVVGIIRRNWRQYCGVLQKSIIKGVCDHLSLKLNPSQPPFNFSQSPFQLNRHLFIPAERRIPKIRIETRQSEELSNQRVIVVVDAWPRHSKYPQVPLTNSSSHMITLVLWSFYIIFDLMLIISLK